MQCSQENLKVALRVLLETGDSTQLRRVISEDSDSHSQLDGEYPDLHRILDFRDGEECFRVVRKVSMNEHLSVQSIDCTSFRSEPGVPLWLSGRELRRWVTEEKEEPSKGPVDWSTYRRNADHT